MAQGLGAAMTLPAALSIFTTSFKEGQRANYSGPNRLVWLDTTNPPGNRRAGIEYVPELAEAAALEPTMRSPDPERPNL
jgi:hypothetical protein